jgi:phosphomannomutase
MSSVTPAFLDYTPVPLAFGTSGMRGLVEDLTDLEAYISVKGALRFLLDMGAAGDGVVLGGDLRPSTERISRSVLRAVTDLGLGVEYAGKLPSPALLLHGLATGRASAMVTGSHIPFDRNGIKINKRGGELLKSDEQGVLAQIARVRAEEYARTAEESPFDRNGMLKEPPALPAVDGAAITRYRQRYLGAFPREALRGLRIAFYAHSAVGRELVPEILRSLGAEVHSVGRSDTFVPIDTEALADAQLDLLARMVDEVERAHGPVDAIVSTDGDSDRPLVAAVTDDPGRRVRFLPGDRLGLVVADYLRADAVSVPISSNDAVEQHLRARGVALCKTRIGSPFVVASMEEQRRAGGRRVVGWEANGGFLVGDDLELPGGTLAALPSRDAVLPILANLAQARALGVTLAGVWERLPARAGRSGLLDDFPAEASRAIMAGLVSAGASTEVSFGGAPVSEDWQRTRATLERLFTSVLGFGSIARIDALDGVRITFADGEVAHLRPSGNAPQLRIYAEATTQARADQIAALCLREPDGILRTLAKAFR